MAKTKDHDPVELLQVRKGSSRPLCWPPAAGGGLRGFVGTVVPRDDPLIDHSGLTQSHLLEPAAPGAVITPCDCKAAQALYLGLGYDSVPFAEEPQAAQDEAQAPAPSAPPEDPSPAPASAKARVNPPKDKGGAKGGAADQASSA